MYMKTLDYLSFAASHSVTRSFLDILEDELEGLGGTLGPIPRSMGLSDPDTNQTLLRRERD